VHGKALPDLAADVVAEPIGQGFGDEFEVVQDQVDGRVRLPFAQRLSSTTAFNFSHCAISQLR
jgi:hypothetical protein